MMPLRANAGVRRLTKTSEFRRVYLKGKRLKGPTLWVYLLPVLETKIRIGISVSIRVAKGATERNRIKRVIKEWLRQKAKARAGKGYDVVVVVKEAPKTGKEGSVAMRKELSLLCQQNFF